MTDRAEKAPVPNASPPECASCNGRSIDFKVLPCGHLLCTECLLRLCGGFLKPQPFRCPKIDCCKLITKAPWTLESIGVTSQPKKLINCRSCTIENPAKLLHVCKECNVENICEDCCLSFHGHRDEITEHERVRLQLDEWRHRATIALYDIERNRDRIDALCNTGANARGEVNSDLHISFWTHTNSVLRKIDAQSRSIAGEVSNLGVSILMEPAQLKRRTSSLTDQLQAIIMKCAMLKTIVEMIVDIVENSNTALLEILPRIRQLDLDTDSDDSGSSRSSVPPNSPTRSDERQATASDKQSPKRSWDESRNIPKKESPLVHKEKWLEISKHYYVVVERPEDKVEMIKKLLSVTGDSKTVLFCKSDETADWLLSQFNFLHNFPVIGLFAKMESNLQDMLIKRFYSGSQRMLITPVQLVPKLGKHDFRWIINFDLTDQQEYLTCFLRSGAGGLHPGLAANLLTEKEKEALKLDEFNGKVIEGIPSKSDIDKIR